MNNGTTYISDYYTVSGSAGDQANQELFLRISDFFDGHPGYSRIASSGSVGIQQTFRVWTAVSSSNKFDVVLKWSWTDSWSFWDISNGYGVGISVGAHASGQAWAGTTTNTNDTYAYAPFKSGSIIMARQSAAGGDYDITKSYLTQIKANVQTDTRVVIAGDNESFCIALDANADGNADAFIYFGKYQALNPNYNFPYIFIHSAGENWLDRATTYGDVALTSGYDACVLATSSSGGVTQSLPLPEKVSFDYVTHYVTPIPASSSYLPYIFEYPISIIGKETGGEYLGYLHDLRLTHSTIPNFSRLGSASRLALSQSGGTGYTLTMPWHSSSTYTGGWYISGSQTLFLTGSSDFGRFGGTGFAIDRLGTTDSMITVITQSIVTSETTLLYRGRSGGNYVYQRGSPPAGATDIVIIDEV